MTAAAHVIPFVVAAVFWIGVSRINRRTRWLRLGEVIFWDAILLILVFLLWLKWF